MKEREHLSPKQLLEALQCCAAPVSEDSCERCPNWSGEAFPDGALADMYTQLLRMCTMLDGKIEKGGARDADQGRDKG